MGLRVVQKLDMDTGGRSKVGTVWTEAGGDRISETPQTTQASDRMSNRVQTIENAPLRRRKYRAAYRPRKGRLAYVAAVQVTGRHRCSIAISPPAHLRIDAKLLNQYRV